MKALKVSELNTQIKAILEQTFLDVCVQGEISSVKVHTSGHIYLSIKDEDSNIKCVMFKGNARGLKITLEVGQSIVIMGSVSVYTQKGEYQILCKSITLAGVGEFALAFENLKNKLQTKGYFESFHKKPMPKFPKRIALLTSATGAAKEDMLKVAQKRWNLVHITLFDTLVQGENAKECIVANLALADSFFGTKEGFDVIVLGRGGGSMEDMWAFNEECVAEAIYRAKTPIISAVGHEVDVFISDFVADLRAPTPSAAMEMLLPDKFEFLRIIDEMMSAYSSVFERYLGQKQRLIGQLKEYFKLYNFQSQYINKREQIQALGQIFVENFRNILEKKQGEIERVKMLIDVAFERKLTHAQMECERLFEALKASNPRSLCKNGYAQISKEQKVCVLQDIAVNEVFELSDLDLHIFAKRVK
ncbi:exodeoxyribonuclease VII large subunit [Helicobacter cinaedi]|uniref:Exodeoxyribonuclease 7 large subunit n=1 Tax=Helicobacter cinaedi CCUG 18818 = ATCC BAA-847 TaxID=537971 RepID=A0AAI8MMK3_9HELI|nr:exodeoxyribonuclease VII large subunit [Helicobacter cinaedi]AWK61712.1 exodeoxyribonuclease VII large subunit [Helicobacter cinaedi]EFR46868.1 exodeoxyribonuclease VII, large subunit [Helicobacter cinaedi CCUG 18818 = ATCC BAA-847]QOQ91615.1 exodeoxyribonuclease VII large subunit [Helicobacter cinaedi]QOQ95812.1 exodeoxyribonuclease VII large subunit [Helicobacter cinaedi]BAM32328.1 exodeoxyribonuclease VII large subunit [Helicobacter cinaedi CCUG 18818 = ATCC BAA-847]